MKRISALLAVLLLFALGSASAQPGIAEMNQATGELSRSFFSARDCCFVLGAIFGITGAAKVYYNWQMGKDHHITSSVAAWFFAALFMILMGPFLQKLFGL